MSREPVHLVRSPAAWMTLVAPARSEIVEVLRLLGPCSAAEIAATLDRPADALYRHIDVLKREGFVRDVGLRKAGRNAEQIFDVVAEDFVIDFAGGPEGPGSAAENKAIFKTASSFLKAMGRTVRDTAAARGLDPRAETRNISINYELSWLTPEKFLEVRALIRRLKALMDESKKTREGRLYMTLAIACPVTRKRRAERTRGGKAGSKTSARGLNGAANESEQPPDQQAAGRGSSGERES